MQFERNVLDSIVSYGRPGFGGFIGGMVMGLLGAAMLAEF